MPKYKSPDGAGINIGGEQFDVDASGCITVPSDNYHSLLTPLGYELQANTAAVVDVVVPPVIYLPPLAEESYPADASAQ